MIRKSLRALPRRRAARGLRLAALMAAAWTAQAAPDFERDVQPLFEQHCYKCHDHAMKGGLRLDNRHFAFLPSDSGEPAIVPGKPEASPLLARVASDDPGHRMPKEGEPLSSGEIATLREWIAGGADWPEEDGASIHWAYVGPERPALPELDSEWPVNPIDFFVLDRLRREGLQPSTEAGKTSLLRRVHLDLVGLPPSPEQLNAFLADDSVNAYEKAVDRLLKSPRYGEKWARHWLDLARYADSNGFQADQLRDNWAFRDWVIRAFNADMPFDQFTVEQLAGDLLPNATVEQKVATGFHRMTTCNVEAGVHPEENRVNQVVDRVNTTGTVWLGTTLECSQCHNHKYDPFTMKDYYQLFAYFNNTPLEVHNPSGKGVSFNFWGPKMELPMSPGQEREVARLKEEIAGKQQTYERESRELAKRQQEWEARMVKALKDAPTWNTLEIVSFSTKPAERHEILEDGSVLLPGKSPANSVYTVRARVPMDEFTAIRLETLTHEALPAKGPGRNHLDGRPNFVLQELEAGVVRDAAGGESLEPIRFVRAASDFAQSNFRPEGLFDGKVERQNGWAIANEFGKPHWVTLGAAGAVNVGEGGIVEFKLIQKYGGGRSIGRFRLSAIHGEPGEATLPEDIAAILTKEKRTKKDRKALTEYFEKTAPELQALRKELAGLKKQLEAIEPDSTLVMVENGEPRETHIMIRGDYTRPGREVGYGLPATLHEPEPDLPDNRLGLARWLVDEDNPLVARVTVNRWWAEIMGQGIVATLEDFGTQAEPPTHPRLLDWLAVEFMEKGWSMKHIHKLIVMSATYRQDARVTGGLLARDPANKLYARGPRFRLSAEQIRDASLAVAGLLSGKMYGPPIMPYQPSGIWRQVGRNEPKWKESPGEDRYRRGIYIVYRRAAPYPSMVNFDAPDRGACTVKRPRTNTPLQALTLMNDPAYVEAALALAQRVLRERPGAPAAERIDHAFRVCLSRPAGEGEIEHLQEVLAGELKAFRKDPETAEKLVNSSGRWKPDPGTDSTELAAWFTIANILLNLDEAVTK